jgi:hypothetical protein
MVTAGAAVRIYLITMFTALTQYLFSFFAAPASARKKIGWSLVKTPTQRRYSRRCHF